MVQPTREAVVAARPVPAKARLGPPESARALAELRLTEALEPQGSGPALRQGLPAQEASARLAPDGFPLQAPSVPV